MADQAAGPSARPTVKDSEYEPDSKQTVWDRFGFRRIGFWFGKDGQQHHDDDFDADCLHEPGSLGFMAEDASQGIDANAQPGPLPRNRRRSRKVVPGLPRPGTFKRQNSERRERLLPVEPHLIERRSASADRRRARSAHRSSSASAGAAAAAAAAAADGSAPPSSPPPNDTSTAPLDGQLPSSPTDQVEKGPVSEVFEVSSEAEEQEELRSDPEGLPPLHTSSSPPLSNLPSSPPEDYSAQARPHLEAVGAEAGGHESRPDNLPPPVEIDEQIAVELEQRWILNLSMHFRDRSDREKFFVTYAETPTKWRRVTISCDYRHAPENSLESDLKAMHYQRDKSARIYESIRESLQDIEFYDTVTNLKLQTSEDDRLHVHVTEDMYEVIQFPPLSAVQHLKCKKFPESSICFDSHLSGFVYRVNVDGQVLIKKELPGPDTVDEFLYEINALDTLAGSQSVIHFGGLVVDDQHQCVKGLLISLAEQGALVDLIFDLKGHIPWRRRERWARQIVQGLSEIHENGFVQGDFTLSNIVIDGEDNAKIIDINRRGCPFGWEPPELSALIKSGQRISMYIGVKSDLFQLGMVLWALATEQDEPERHPRPLGFDDASDIPPYYRKLVSSCLSDSPRDRVPAKDLLGMFPILNSEPHRQLLRRASYSELADQKERQTLSDETGRDFDSRPVASAPFSNGSEERISTAHPSVRQPTLKRMYICEESDNDSLSSAGSGHGRRQSRGRLPSANMAHVNLDHDHNDPSHVDSTLGWSNEPEGSEGAQIISISPSNERQWEEVDIGGHPYLLRRETFKDLDEPFESEDIDSTAEHLDTEETGIETSHVETDASTTDPSSHQTIQNPGAAEDIISKDKQATPLLIPADHVQTSLPIRTLADLIPPAEHTTSSLPPAAHSESLPEHKVSRAPVPTDADSPTMNESSHSVVLPSQGTVLPSQDSEEDTLVGPVEQTDRAGLVDTHVDGHSVEPVESGTQDDDGYFVGSRPIGSDIHIGENAHNGGVKPIEPDTEAGEKLCHNIGSELESGTQAGDAYNLGSKSIESGTQLVDAHVVGSTTNEPDTEAGEKRHNIGSELTVSGTQIGGNTHSGGFKPITLDTEDGEKLCHNTGSETVESNTHTGDGAHNGGSKPISLDTENGENYGHNIGSVPIESSTQADDSHNVGSMPIESDIHIGGNVYNGGSTDSKQIESASDTPASHDHTIRSTPTKDWDKKQLANDFLGIAASEV